MSDKEIEALAIILNDPTLTWKIKRALIKLKFTFTEAQIKELVPNE